MNIYNSTQIKSWDAYTVHHEPIASIDLMERAAKRIFEWIEHHFQSGTQFVCICGTGNNGGDGLAVARLLFERGFGIRVFLSDSGSMSTDCRVNLDRLKEQKIKVDFFSGISVLPDIPPDALIIDALFGTGLSRPIEGSIAEVVNHLNNLPNKILSIDMPSGLPADALAANDAVIEADYTLTFQCPKFSFFLPEHARFTGQWSVLDIGLDPAFEQSQRAQYVFIDEPLVRYFKPVQRSVHSHKGNFGHAVIIGGSEGMMGAPVMAAKACLRSGVGLLTTAVSDWGMPIMQVSVPEAMCIHQSNWMNHMFYNGKTAIGVGMGWQHDEFHSHLLQWLLSNVTSPLLLDASALNILSHHMDWLNLRPKDSETILTPHIGEFVRLAGKCETSVERMEKAKNIASQYQLFIVLKGAYTQVITPGGLVYFNSTGNPGMAKGGSGDVLAGLLTGLLAQGLAPSVACLLGVYLHGLAGDLAAQQLSQPGMTAMDIGNYLPMAWKKVLVG